MPTRAFNHVAVSVTEIENAVRWYQSLIQMTILVEPTEITAYENEHKDYDPYLAELVRMVFGPKLGKFKICYMSLANGVGIELFQFIEPPAEQREKESNFEYWKTGYFHIAITEPDIEELAGKIASNGGKRRTDVIELVPGSGKKICFFAKIHLATLSKFILIAMSNSGLMQGFKTQIIKKIIDFVFTNNMNFVQKYCCNPCGLIL